MVNMMGNNDGWGFIMMVKELYELFKFDGHETNN